MAVPKARFFFEEVRAIYGEVADRFQLSGPVEKEWVVASSRYSVGELVYAVMLDRREGSVVTSVEVNSDSIFLSMELEDLAMALGVVDRRGGFSESARSQKQLKNSLLGQVVYVELVHPLLSEGKAEAVMIQAGARRWR
ncbi:hypothetical protein [Streptomyces sp. NPDC046909]|uniref:hypothetical protein n=1 Tax=Streptomyces sp. NPDC046909 TaxID=3155617 RepID=UPI0033CA6B12